MQNQAWLNWCGASGIVIYLGTHWCIIRGLGSASALWTRAFRLIGLAMILTPLFLSWYLNADQLVLAGVLIAIISAHYLRRARRP